MSKRNIFKSVTMPNGSEIDWNCTSLTGTTDINSLIVVKLKCKAEYHSHILFKPSCVGSFLRFLKQFNHWYSDIEIDLDNVSETGQILGMKQEIWLRKW